MVRKISVHLMLLSSAEKNTGSAKIVRKLSRPTKVGVETPSHSTKAIAIVRSAGIKMITTLITRAGKRKGIGESGEGGQRSGRQRRGAATPPLLGFGSARG